MDLLRSNRSPWSMAQSQPNGPPKPQLSPHCRTMTGPLLKLSCASGGQHGEHHLDHLALNSLVNERLRRVLMMNVSSGLARLRGIVNQTAQPQSHFVAPNSSRLAAICTGWAPKVLV